MDSEFYSRTSVRGRRFVFQVLNIHFLREGTEHDARMHQTMGLHPARSSSAAAAGLPTAADVPAARALSATSAGALFQPSTARALSPATAGGLFQSSATGTLPPTAARRLRLPTGAL